MTPVELCRHHPEVSEMELIKNTLKNLLFHIMRRPELGGCSGVITQFVDQFTGSTAKTSVCLNDEWNKGSMISTGTFKVLQVFSDFSLSRSTEA